MHRTELVNSKVENTLHALICFHATHGEGESMKIKNFRKEILFQEAMKADQAYIASIEKIYGRFGYSHDVESSKSCGCIWRCQTSCGRLDQLFVASIC